MVFRVAKAVLDEWKEGRRVTFHGEVVVWVVLAKFANVADVLVEPLIRYDAAVGPPRSAGRKTSPLMPFHVARA